MASDTDMELPGQDYMRVLAVCPKSPPKKKLMRNWLVDAAQALQDDELWEPPRNFRSGLPEGFVYDKPFFAVAVGKTYPGSGDVSPKDVEPKNSEYFVIRGFVKAKGPEAIPRKIDNDLELFSDPNIFSSLTCGTDRAVGSVGDVSNKLDFAKLTAEHLDGDRVAVAMVDSGIYLPFLDPARTTRPSPKYPLAVKPRFDEPNSWRPHGVATPPGLHRIGHGTMCAYNVLAAAPKATLLDYPILIARAPGDHTVKGTVGAAIQAYLRLRTVWIKNLSKGAKAKYRALVVNNSWGILHPCEEDFPPGHSGRFIDNPNHPFHTLVRQLAGLGADIVFAAGNGGLPCPTPPFLHLTTGSIRGANAYQEVLTVAGCDVNDSRVGYSSQGPSVAMFPLPPQEKPDLTAYTHFLGSQVFGEREPDRGTSTACPIAAGCVAALRTKLPPAGTSPKDLFDTLRATARRGNGGGPGGAWNDQYGYGIIDPVAAGRSLGVI